jgi:serine/threonine protein kinase
VFCSKNQHKNILIAIDYGLQKIKDKSIPFYVMPLYNDSLRKLMTSEINSKDILQFFSQILDGVEAAHFKKHYHRDIKPENILYNSKTNLLVLADFGIAHFSEDELYTTVETKPTSRLANFEYAAPEQRKAGQLVDHRADIYALGLILNEFFTKTVPHGAGYKKIADIHAEYAYLDKIVEKMIMQSPLERYSSIDEIKKDLIAHKNEFISQQRLSELKNAVISVSDIDDPLAIEPPQLVGVDWDDNFLKLQLSQSVTNKWIQVFRNISNYEYMMDGTIPSSCIFSPNSPYVSIRAMPDRANQVANLFKTWLNNANGLYRETIRKEKEQQERRFKQELQNKVQMEEARSKVLKNIRI